MVKIVPASRPYHKANPYGESGTADRSIQPFLQSVKRGVERSLEMRKITYRKKLVRIENLYELDRSRIDLL